MGSILPIVGEKELRKAFEFQDTENEDIKANKNCYTVMCEMNFVELEDLENFDLTELAKLNLCTHLVFRTKLIDGQADKEFLRDVDFLQKMQFLRKMYPSLEILAGLSDPDYSDVSFENYFTKSRKQKKLFDSIMSMMRFYNFNGFQMRVVVHLSQTSEEYTEATSNLARFLKGYWEQCQSNNWTLDIEITKPIALKLEAGGFVNKLWDYFRYLIISEAFQEESVSHNFPLYGDNENSLYNIMKSLEEMNIDRDRVVMELPIYGRIYVPKVNETWNTTDATKLIGYNGDMAASREDINISGVTSYNEICEYAFTEEPEWMFFKDHGANSTFLYKENMWLTTETTATLREKIQFVTDYGIHRFILLDIHNDDYVGDSCENNYPLLKSVFYTVSSNVNCTNGNDDKIVESDTVEVLQETLQYEAKFLTIISVAVIIILALLITNLYLLRKSRVGRNTRTEIIIPEIIAGLEVPIHEYQIYADFVLGQGQSSVVLKGKVLNEDVAVKIPKRNAKSFTTVGQQLKEIEFLATLNEHKNILDLIGFNTKLISQGYIYQFLEMCSLGSLDKFLVSHRDSFVNLIENFEMDKDPSYEKNNHSKDKELRLEGFNTRTLLAWTFQLCEAMDYISNHNIVHGDLSARNILVKSLDNLKICDFGLARKLESSESMIKIATLVDRRKDSIPWKWMAIETLEDGIISLVLDVWSFGVTMWEIFSLGEVPYAGLEWTPEFVGQLKGGLKLQPPRYSTLEMYNELMLPCWIVNYKERPTFASTCFTISSYNERRFSDEYSPIVNL